LAMCGTERDAEAGERRALESEEMSTRKRRGRGAPEVCTDSKK
jgi:hypothetical protein